MKYGEVPIHAKEDLARALSRARESAGSDVEVRVRSGDEVFTVRLAPGSLGVRVEEIPE